MHRLRSLLQLCRPRQPLLHHCQRRCTVVFANDNKVVHVIVAQQHLQRHVEVPSFAPNLLVGASFRRSLQTELGTSLLQTAARTSGPGMRESGHSHVDTPSPLPGSCKSINPASQRASATAYVSSGVQVRGRVIMGWEGGNSIGAAAAELLDLSFSA